MALCAYCGKVDVAWRQIGRNWVACYAKKDANGVIVKAEVRSGEKTVMRPVPVPDAPHYPVKVSPAIYDGRDAGTYGTWCPEWTAEKAAKAIPRGKGKRQQPAPLPPLMPITPAGLGIVGLDGMPVPRPTPAPAPAPPTPPAPPPYIVPYVGSPVDYERLRGETRAEVVKILDEYGVKPPVAELHIIGPDGRVKVDGQFHAQVPALISRLARGKHVYLYGGAGAGKTHAACQALEAVCGNVNVLTMPGLTTGKLFGFTDASGVYRDTPFVRAYRDGGGIVLDELDRAMPAVAAALNSVLENRRATFDGIEAPMHTRFALVATGNTDMRGGTRTYTGAQPLDLATAARFAFVYWTVDVALETSLVEGIVGKGTARVLLAWGRAIRERLAADRHDTVFAGPREMVRIAEDLAAGVSMADAANAWIWRGLEAATVARVLASHPLPVIGA